MTDGGGAGGDPGHLERVCIVIEQLVEILEEVAFDEGQLDLAKFAYEHVYDLENYYEVYGVFSFSSSSEELDAYIQSQY